MKKCVLYNREGSSNRMLGSQIGWRANDPFPGKPYNLSFLPATPSSLFRYITSGTEGTPPFRRMQDTMCSCTLTQKLYLIWFQPVRCADCHHTIQSFGLFKRHKNALSKMKFQVRCGRACKKVFPSICEMLAHQCWKTAQERWQKRIPNLQIMIMHELKATMRVEFF